MLQIFPLSYREKLPLSKSQSDPNTSSIFEAASVKYSFNITVISQPPSCFVDNDACDGSLLVKTNINYLIIVHEHIMFVFKYFI